MDSNEENEGEWVPCPKQGKAEKGRGATKMRKIVRARHTGKVFQPSWNHNGLPIGKDSVSMMSYWGTTIRKNVPINIRDWKHVPQSLLDSSFEELKLIYKVDESKRKLMMTKANIAWRNFKSSLSREWIWTEDMEIRKTPPKKYNFIKLSNWTEFVTSRVTEEWEEKSEAARKSAKGNVYPQKRGRRGYARFEQDVIEELAMKGIHETSLGRGQLWKLIRRDKNGDIVEGAKAVASRIDYFMSLSEQGEMEDIGRQDALSRALEKKEHGGRVIGVGVGGTNTGYFGTIQTKKEYMDQVTKLCSRVQSLEREVKRIKRKKDDEETSQSEEDEDDCQAKQVHGEKKDLETSKPSEIEIDNIPEIPQSTMECGLVPSSAYSSGSRDQLALVGKTTSDRFTNPVDSTTFTVKAFWKEEIVKFLLTTTTSFKDLKKIVYETFKMPEYLDSFNLKYEDEEGDKVLMATDENLEIALRSRGSIPSTTLKLFVVNA